MRHWFLPHKETHKKATLISWEGMLIYVLLFMLLQVGFSITSFVKPGVLGTSSNIEIARIIELTNQERAKNNLPPLQENSALDKAAQAKAANMFAEDYWAHFAPSGKTPWDFILGSGYSFSFAGENLAKNFQTNEGVVIAWMNSPSHRENIVSVKYKDIGIAVVDGVINGQKTTLVVQMFGSTQALAGKPEVNINGEKMEISAKQYNKQILPAATLVSGSTIKALIDPYQVSKGFGLAVILFIGGLLLVDFVVLKRRGVFRLTSNHAAHFALLSTSAIAIFTNTPGSIL